MVKPTQIIAQKSALHAAAQRAAAVADEKSAMPILSHVLLTAQAGKLTYAATDLASTVEGELSAMVDQELGAKVAFCLHAKRFAEVLGVMPEGEVTITLKSSRVIVRAGRRTFELATLDAGDFPTVERAQKFAVELEARLLRDLIARTAPSMSDDDTRPHLRALYLALGASGAGAGADARQITVVSTDGHRLTVVQAPAPDGAATFSILVPGPAVHEIARVLDATTKAAAPKKGAEAQAPTVRLSTSQNLVSVEAHGVVFTSKLVDAAFPSYAQVMPVGWESTVRVNRDEALGALTATSVVEGKNSAVALAVSGADLSITSQVPDVGSASDEVAAEVEGKPPKIGLNSRYLRTALQSALACERVELCLSGALDPLVVRAERGAPEQGGVVASVVVMPLRLDSDGAL